LKRKRVVVEATSAEAFWEAISAELAKEYDLEHCQVVINGDGAEWISQRVEYLPQAVFQFDRFHWPAPHSWAPGAMGWGSSPGRIPSPVPTVSTRPLPGRFACWIAGACSAKRSLGLAREAGSGSTAA